MLAKPGTNVFDREWLRVSVLTVILAVQGALVWWECAVLSPCVDEYPHLIAGIEYWRTGNLSLYNVNPPLHRLWAGLHLDHEHLQVPNVDFSEYSRTKRFEFVRGHLFSTTYGARALDTLVRARRHCIPAALLATLGVYLLASELVAPWPGLLAATLWAFNPVILGSSALLTCDISSAAAFCWMSISWVYAIRSGRMLWFVGAGVLLGLAVLTKFVCLIGFVLFPIAVVLGRPPKQEGKGMEGRSLVFKLVAFFLGAVFVINAGYGFHRSGTPLGSFRFVSALMRGDTVKPGNRFWNSGFESLPVPLPAAMLEGLDQQWEDFDKPRPCFLNGEWKMGGWYYYYLVALCIKLPIPFLVMLILAIPYLAKSRSLTLFCCLPAATLFLIVSSKINMCEHTRYLWAILPQLSVMCFAGAAQWGRMKCLTAVLCTGWVIFVGITSFPFGTAYGNELVGRWGVSRVLAGSNCDWGQGWLSARDWLNANRSRGQLIAVVEPARLRLDSLNWPKAADVREVLKHETKLSAVPVLILVSTADRMRLQRRQNVDWMSESNQVERVGCCIEIYSVTAFELRSFTGSLMWYP